MKRGVNRRRSAFVFLFLGILIPHYAFRTPRLEAGESGGTTGAPFLRVGASPRAAAMGEAFTAVSDNATAVFWNPAGLAAVKWREVYASHQSWIENIRLSHAAYAQPVGENWAVAGGVAHASSGDLLGKDEFDRDTENFEATDLAVTLAGARRFGAVHAGAGAKFLRQTIGDESGAGAALDLGVQYRSPAGGQTFTWAAALKEAGGKMGPGTKADLPTAVHLGVSDRLLKETVLLSAEAAAPFQGDWTAGLGAEVLVGGMVFLRGGYRIGLADVTGFDAVTAGLGILYSSKQDYVIDYSFAGQGSLGAAHRFSLTLKF